jgi:phasin
LVAVQQNLTISWVTVGRSNEGPQLVRIGSGADPRQLAISAPRNAHMSETTEISTSPSRPKYKPVPASAPAPKFELPSFEVPKIEIPVVLRELAEKSVSQAKETYEKLKSAADEATDVLEETYATATKGASDLSLKLIEAARENTNAAFDFAAEIMTVKSLSDVVELSTRHTRKQYEAVAAQAKELTAIAQKVAVETSEPLKECLGKFKVA